MLLTTPESLSFLLTRADLDEQLGALDTVIVDEWHELLGTKRGVQVELALSHLRARRPILRARALSGILRDLPEAARAAAGVGSDPALVTATMARLVLLHTVLPDEPRALPWAGHFGPRMLPSLLTVLDPLFAVQRRVSHVPREDELLVEVTRSREGVHAFVFPFEGGALVHEGLAAIIATRLSRRQKVTLGLSANGHGFELLAEGDFPFAEAFGGGATALLSEAAWLDDLMEGMALGELERRHFREVARVAGLVFQGRPGAVRTAKQLQVSASLLHDVVPRHEPGHPAARADGARGVGDAA